MKGEDLRLRTKRFALMIIELVGTLPKRKEAEAIGYQLLKAGTSVGANYHEAQRARSRADFISKIGICEQEMAETLYWLELLAESGIVPAERLKRLMEEGNQILAILVAIAKSARHS